MYTYTGLFSPGALVFTKDMITTVPSVLVAETLANEWYDTTESRRRQNPYGVRVVSGKMRQRSSTLALRLTQIAKWLGGLAA